MAHIKKKYSNGQSRGGTSPTPSNTAFGGLFNQHKSPKKYERATDLPPPIGAHLLKPSN